jgi:hypothetical protein
VNRSARLVLPLFAAGVLILQLGWALSVPAFWGMDEPDHVARAASVAHGHWLPATVRARPESGRGERVVEPADIARAAAKPCLARLHHLRGNCVGDRGLEPGTVTIDSAAGRYNPVYYAVVGLAASPFHGNGFLFALRAGTAILSCALLVGALWSVLTWARTRWPIVALLLVVTPTTLYSTTVAAPNGVHLSAAITLWCTLLALGKAPDERTRSRLLLLSVVASAATVNTHSLGIVWVPLIFLVSWYANGAPDPRGLLATANARRWILLMVLPYLAAVAWVVMARTNSPYNELTQGRTDSPVPSIVLGWLVWPLQAVAAAPDRIDGAPAAVYAIWLVGAALLFWTASRVLRRKERRAVALLVIVSFAIPSVLTLMTFSRLGAAWQGRYGYPLSLGVLLLLAVAGDRARRRDLPPVLAGLVVALFVTGQVLAQIGARNHSLANRVLVETTQWHPPSTILFVLCGIVACVLLALSLVAATRSLQPAGRPAAPVWEVV